MKKVISQIVKSPGAPSENDLWIDDSAPDLVAKVFDNGEWVEVLGVDKTVSS